MDENTHQQFPTCIGTLTGAATYMELGIPLPVSNHHSNTQIRTLLLFGDTFIHIHLSQEIE